MEEKIELDLNNPIFVAYINVEGFGRQRAEEILAISKKTFDVYKNITFWIIASDKNSIECVYDGQCKNRNIEINDLIQKINNRIDILSKSRSFEDFKINIRDWRINELIDNSI